MVNIIMALNCVWSEAEGKSLALWILPGNASNPWGLPDCEGSERDTKRRSRLFVCLVVVLITRYICLPGHLSLTDIMGWSQDLDVFVPLPLREE